MATLTTRKPPVTAFVIALVAALVLGAGLLYLSRPATQTTEAVGASPDAKDYLRYLKLSDVSMQATENFMKQQVVEIQGKIANTGSRKLTLIEVTCLFSGVDGNEIYRERLAIAHDLASQQTQTFRLPFDSLPDGWNQAMPRLVIARISFAS